MKSEKKGWDAAMRIVLIAVVMAVIFLPLLGSANADIPAPVLTYKLDGQVVHLSWNATPNATEYKVYYSEDNSTFTLLGNTSKLYYKYTQPWNKTYYYYVIAANATAESAHSNVVKVVTPKEPTSSSGGAGWTVGTIVFYAPYFWLGAFFVVVGILLIAYARFAKGRHKSAGGFGALLLMLGVVVGLASVVLPYFHLL